MPQSERQRKEPAESRLRLQTAVKLRWFGVIGQLLTVCFVYLVLGFPLPIGICLALIALSAWLNVFLRIRFPARTRLSTQLATSLLAYDILQLAGLLYLTGGVENPFTFLLVAPVTVSAATVPPRATVTLGILAAAASVWLVAHHHPLPWYGGANLAIPQLYKLGVLASVLSGMVFLALYVWRLAKEARQMTDALAATEMVLAREQQLHALDGLAAAAAHELGTPLATITLVTKELARELPPDSPMAEDIALLQAQAVRCREILRKLTRTPSEPDPLHARMSITQLIDEAAGPYRGFDADIIITTGPEDGAMGADAQEPVGARRPGVIYGLGNLVENAIDFARDKVEISAVWSSREVTITIADDGQGVPPDVMDALGEPYITTRPSRSSETGQDGEASGLGLGFFIAKTLLERSGATVSLENREFPATGAVAKVSWPRESFVNQQAATQAFVERRAEALGASLESGIR
jgi:two-component system, sensor histidine kinase RegB